MPAYTGYPLTAQSTGNPSTVSQRASPILNVTYKSQPCRETQLVKQSAETERHNYVQNVKCAYRYSQCDQL